MAPKTMDELLFGDPEYVPAGTRAASQFYAPPAPPAEIQVSDSRMAKDLGAIEVRRRKGKGRNPAGQQVQKQQPTESQVRQIGARSVEITWAGQGPHAIYLVTPDGERIQVAAGVAGGKYRLDDVSKDDAFEVVPQAAGAYEAPSLDDEFALEELLELGEDEEEEDAAASAAELKDLAGSAAGQGQVRGATSQAGSGAQSGSSQGTFTQPVPVGQKSTTAQSQAGVSAANLTARQEADGRVHLEWNMDSRVVSTTLFRRSVTAGWSVRAQSLTSGCYFDDVQAGQLYQYKLAQHVVVGAELQCWCSATVEVKTTLEEERTQVAVFEQISFHYRYLGEGKCEVVGHGRRRGGAAEELVAGFEVFVSETATGEFKRVAQTDNHCATYTHTKPHYARIRCGGIDSPVQYVAPVVAKETELQFAPAEQHTVAVDELLELEVLLNPHIHSARELADEIAVFGKKPRADVTRQAIEELRKELHDPISKDWLKRQRYMIFNRTRVAAGER